MPGHQRPPGRLRDVGWTFLRMGALAFGGPAAHVAMMREELVRRRGWLDDARFLDLWGATHLVPGPNSTELAIHLGHERAGWRGLVLAGVAFIGPAALMVTALAWLYVEHGTTPSFVAVLAGVVPAVLAMVLWALVGLVRPALRTPLLAVLAAGVLAAQLLGVHELVLLLGGGLAVVLLRGVRRVGGPRARRPGGPAAWAAPGLVVLERVGGGDLTTLFWTMLKIGAVLYGSGYVILAFLEGEFVDRLGWITPQQLLDAVSVGQVTPGPLFTSATFVGYLVAGLPGAFVATVAVFLPSFLLVTLLLLWRTRWNSGWYVLGSAVVGGLVHWAA